MNEKELVKQAQAGDFEAFSELIGKYQSRVFNLARRMTGNVDDAEDILQETLLKAVDNIDKFRGESAFGTWLYSIALNAGRAFLNREKRAELKPIEEYLPTQEHGDSGALFEWRDPHRVMEQKQLRKFIDEAIDDLRAEYSIPFILRYLEELPVKEIARLMHLSEAATKSRILRARLYLREKLASVMQIEDQDEKVL
jgi:RNA polymerase sigma-70 factor (ECF subfamily)